MRHAERIENIIKNFCVSRRSAVKTTNELDKRIINDVLLAQENLKKTQSAALQPNIWRIIMKSRITKFAVAVMIIIVLIIGMNYLDTPID